MGVENGFIIYVKDILDFIVFESALNPMEWAGLLSKDSVVGKPDRLVLDLGVSRFLFSEHSFLGTPLIFDDMLLRLGPWAKPSMPI